MFRPGPVEKKLIIGLILSLCYFNITWAQITSSTADRIDTISYNNSPGEDPLFVFYQINRVHKSGSLSATLPGTDNYNFEWSKYNPTINGFEPPFSSDVSVTSSNVSDLDEGGYRVRIWDGITTDTSILTSLANDYGYEVIFAKQIEALGNKADVAIGISTSGKAKNVIQGIKRAKEKNLKTIALTGCDGGTLRKVADISLVVPSKITARIQEAHITIGHVICELAEEALCA